MLTLQISVFSVVLTLRGSVSSFPPLANTRVSYSVAHPGESLRCRFLVEVTVRRTARYTRSRKRHAENKQHRVHLDTGLNPCVKCLFLPVQTTATAC